MGPLTNGIMVDDELEIVINEDMGCFGLGWERGLNGRIHGTYYHRLPYFVSFIDTEWIFIGEMPPS
jgi:hypothetical protein